MVMKFGLLVIKQISSWCSLYVNLEEGNKDKRDSKEVKSVNFEWNKWKQKIYQGSGNESEVHQK